MLFFGAGERHGVGPVISAEAKCTVPVPVAPMT